MLITVRAAINDRDLEAIGRLRTKVFASEGTLPNGAAACWLDEYDHAPATFNVMAEVDGELAGAFRVTIDGPVGLPCDAYLAPSMLAEVRGAHACGSMLCVDRAVRGHLGLFERLLATGFGWAWAQGKGGIVAAANPTTARGLRRLGFRNLSEEFAHPSTGRRVQPVVVRRHELEPALRAHSDEIAARATWSPAVLIAVAPASHPHVRAA